MRRYPAYRDSGVDWLGEVPEGWEVAPLRRIAVLNYGDALASDIRDESGRVEVFGSNGPVGFHTSANALGPTILVGRKGSYGALNWSEADCFAIDTVYFVDRTGTRANLRWLFYALHLARFEGSSQDTGVPGLSRNVAYGARLPLPPLPEQTAIAAFLDRETAKIDALVAEQRRLIALLREKRQAVISHAVTRGLNPEAPLKPSGIDWLGDVPEGWEVVQLRRLIKAFEQGYSPDCFAYPAAPGEWGVLKSGCVNRGIYREEENKALPPNVEPRPQWEVAPGDLLMSRASGSPELIGSVAVVGDTQGRILMSDKIFRLKLQPAIFREFAYWTFASDGLRAQIVNAISGGDGMANNLPQSSIKEFVCALPPLIEQQEIAAFLAAESQKTDALVTEAETAIALLQERRAALISATVTGKIDVRDLADTATEAA